jgi:4-diphosphocytidyl-2-C-methyl-D-erythritol kinase
LHIEGKLPNGYHLLKSLVCFAEDIFDKMTIYHNTEFELKILNKNLNINLQDNLISKAYRLLIENFNISSSLQKIKIILEKNIPLAAGLGGGSADAALVLTLLTRLWSLDKEKVLLLSKQLGADVPVCMASYTCLVSGIGEQVSSPIILPDFYMLVVNPNKILLTKKVFEINHQYSSVNMQINKKYNQKSLVELLNQTSNNLEEAAVSIVSEIDIIKAVISSHKECITCRMSGSGASVIGIFFERQHAQNAADFIQKQYPQWWVAVSTNL